METAIEMREFAEKLRTQIDGFLKKFHEEHQEEFSYFVTRAQPDLSLIDNLAAQRLLVRSVAYNLVKEILAEQLPVELLEPDLDIPDQPKSEETNAQSSIRAAD